MKSRLIRGACLLACLSALLFAANTSFAQPLRPNLGTASTYVVFTGGGAIINTGASYLVGDVGQDGAYAFNGFPPGIYTGALNRANTASALAKADLLNAWTVEAGVTDDFVLGVGIVDGQIFHSAVYHSGAASTTTGNITFDAQNIANAIFIVKIGGQLDANAGTHILLANGAKSSNIYWFVDGAVNIADGSTFKGIIFARGAISFAGTSSLDGRALVAPGGAINLTANIMSEPADTLIVVRPALADTIRGATQNYQITWSGSGIAARKIFAYSLDSGLTWRTIDTISADVFTHTWNLPDTISNKAFIRVTDSNGRIGKSGLFTIISSKIIVTQPALAAIITGGTLNDTIRWTGTGLTPRKIFAYSLDSGLTWRTIDTMHGNGFTHTWNVPDTVSTRAMIRITDSLGITGNSGMFTIGSSKITVTQPALAAIITGGTLNDTIRWTGTGLTPRKIFAYSLDSGLTWRTIDTMHGNGFTHIWNVPDTASKRAMIRITDSLGITGKSGMFTIKSSKIIVVHPAFAAVITRGMQNYQITWTGTGLTSRKIFAYSLDSGLTWRTIDTMNGNGFTHSWNLPDTVSTRAMIRIIDSLGITGKSGMFTIGSSKIIVVRPALAAIITGGTQNYAITWTGIGLTTKKTFDLSLDGGLTWKTIGIMLADSFTYKWNVPDTVSTLAMIRITDTNGITGKSGVFTIKSSKIIVIHPAPGEILASGTLNYQILWSGTGLTPRKTFELSLDGGITFKLIGTLTADVFTYYWFVPDTASTLAVIRITDTNGISGKSGVFTIQSSQNIIVVHPAFGEVVAAGTQGFQITWAGTGLTSQKSFELSLDGGLSWTPIGTITADVFTYSWNVPDTVSSQAMIRITNNNGTTTVSGVSGIFSIRRNVGSIVVTHPLTGEVLDGGYVNFPITFTATNVTAQKTFEYSLNGGATWSVIGVMNSDAQTFSWASVPNVATTKALVRITDGNGVIGISGLFTISVKPNIGTINEVILSGLDSKNNIANSQNLGITWTYTPDIGTSVEVEYSLDNMVTWSHIATIVVSESPNSTAWLTTPTGYHNPVFIRVTSSLGMSRLSMAFSIGSSASVASEASTNGYMVSNYPNPVIRQTTMHFVLPVRSDVTLIVSDNLGREVSVLSGTFESGMHDIPFNTAQLADGIYTYSFVAGRTRLNGRMSVVR